MRSDHVKKIQNKILHSPFFSNFQCIHETASRWSGRTAVTRRKISDSNTSLQTGMKPSKTKSFSKTKQAVEEFLRLASPHLSFTCPRFQDFFKKRQFLRLTLAHLSFICPRFQIPKDQHLKTFLFTRFSSC